MVDVLAYRLSLTLVRSVGHVDYELASQYVETVEDVPPTSRSAANTLDVSTAEIGRVLGKSTSYRGGCRGVARGSPGTGPLG